MISKNSNKGFLSLIALLIVLAIIVFLAVSRFDLFGANNSQAPGSISPINVINQETQINDQLNKIETQSNNYGQQQKDIFDKVNNLFPKK